MHDQRLYLLTGSRARRAADPLAPAPSTNRRRDRPNRPNGLTKQTYSALVYLPGSSHPRKWHVVTYFSVSQNAFTMIRSWRRISLTFSQGDDYLRLPVIESYEYLRNLRVPEGIFTSSKGNGARNDRYSVADSRECYALADIPAQPDLSRVSQYPISHEVPSRPLSSTSASPSSSMSPMSRHPQPSPTPSTTTSWPSAALPNIASLTSPHPRSNFSLNLPSSHPVRLNHPAPSSYKPLSAEDRRVLSSFRVVL